MSKSYVVPKLVLKELQSLNVDWQIEHGTRHGKLIVNGVFCGIVSCGRRGEGDDRFALNLRSQIRRALGK